MGLSDGAWWVSSGVVVGWDSLCCVSGSWVCSVGIGVSWSLFL